MSHLHRAVAALTLCAALLGGLLHWAGVSPGWAVLAVLIAALVLDELSAGGVAQSRIQERERELLAQRRGASGPAADFEREADA